MHTYYRLTKPGIIYGNLLNTTAGFLLASPTGINLGAAVAALSGTALIIASACVVNNYIDRHIDAKMARTKKRALVVGDVSKPAALTYATILGLAGLAILAMGTNVLTVAIGVVGFLSYVVLYGIAKRRSIYGTLVGSISGATPPVAGYVAATNQLDMGAVLLFLILVFWQMPHFYAIAIYRLQDYKNADIPVWPAVKGIAATKRQMCLYVIAFIIATIGLFSFGYTGVAYLVTVLVVGLRWLYVTVQGFRAPDDVAWAKRMFGASLTVTMTMLVALSLGPRLP